MAKSTSPGHQTTDAPVYHHVPVSRRAFLTTALLAGAGCTGALSRPSFLVDPEADAVESLRRAARYLWSQQADDGAWHSNHYGLLRSGQSLTPFVLDALLQVPQSVYQPERKKVVQAVSFMLHNVDADGALGRADPSLPDYPNYATAFALKSLVRVELPNRLINTAPMVDYLRRQQFTEQNGWHPHDAPYGAWGMGGDVRTPPNAGHVDLSMTRNVLQALAVMGVPPDGPAMQKARVYVERCHNYDAGKPGTLDGGFYFSTVVLDANKAGEDGDRFRSYGTATADGILSLLALGYGPTDKRVQAAARWLTAHHRANGATGFEGEAYRRWPQGLRYYYAAASTEALRRLGLAREPRVSEALRPLQQPDGSWSNAEDLVKEDDPLIATPFAVRAFVNETGANLQG